MKNYLSLERTTRLPTGIFRNLIQTLSANTKFILTHFFPVKVYIAGRNLAYYTLVKVSNHYEHHPKYRWQLPPMLGFATS